MDTNTAIQTGEWLANNFREFMQDDERPDIMSRTSHWLKDDDVLHASSVSKCPKKTAARAVGAIEDKFDDFSTLRMAQGTAMGHYVAQYAYWLQNKQNEAALIGDVPILSVDHEHPLYDSAHHLAGSVDIMMGFVNADVTEYFPVEVKLTDAWKYGGITLDQFVQTCVYIRMKRQQPSAICNTGYIFAIYDKREAPVPWKVWCIRYLEADKGYVIIADGELKFINGLPSNGKYTFLPDEQLSVWISEHHEWTYLVREAPNWQNSPQYNYDYPTWECSVIKEPEFRKTSWTDPSTGVKYPAGSLKSGTGTVTINCPLFKFCWPNLLLSWGINPTGDIPKKFEMKVSANE